MKASALRIWTIVALVIFVLSIISRFAWEIGMFSPGWSILPSDSPSSFSLYQSYNSYFIQLPSIIYYIYVAYCVFLLYSFGLADTKLESTGKSIKISKSFTWVFFTTIIVFEVVIFSLYMIHS